MGYSMKVERIFGNTTDETILSISKALESADCSAIIEKSTSSNQKDKQKYIRAFQSKLASHLKEYTGYKWETEKSASFDKKVSIDIYGEVNDYRVIIEIDTIRADQIAKKFVSRAALCIDQPLIYVILLYPGTESMNKEECLSYMSYCNDILTKIGKGSNPNILLGFEIK